jgi:glycerophosphoryl diester phosphodiesterase
MTQFPQLDGFRGGPGLIRLIGHRGARGVMPENTIEGFAFTLDIGVRALEFDVVLTRDRVPVITHNHHLANSATRGCDGKWLTGPEPKVAALTLEEIRGYDVGGLDGHSIYGQRFPDQAFLSGLRVPRLTELLDLACQPEHSDLSLLLELKSDPEVRDDTTERREVVAAVVAEVRARSLEPRTVLHSFDWDLLDECRAQAPDMPTSYLSQLPENSDDPGEDSSKAVGPDYRALTVSVPRAVRDAGGQMWCPYYLDVTRDLVEEAHALGLLVSVWTVNEHDDIERMIDAGVDGIVSDYPGRVQRHLLNRNLHWM